MKREIETSAGTFARRAWTGGESAPAGERRRNPAFRELVRFFFREAVSECGGLDFWKCAGTGSLERARIFWNRARLDAWRTFESRAREQANRARYPRHLLANP